MITLVRSAFLFLMAAIKWGKKNVVAPPDTGSSLPPIRCYGDPKDIYLA